MEQELLRLENLSKFYTGQQSVVVGLDHIDLRFCAGEFVAVTGESGSGKSTLAQVLGGILRYEGGEMYFGGKPTSHYDGADWERYRRDQISFISQSYGILAGCTVERNVYSALRLAGISGPEAREKTERILRQVELWDLRSRRAAKLSSGQKQRLSIARALAKPAPILLADEPTGNLDPDNSAKIIKLLAQAARERLVILITHEFSEAEDYATRRISLADGAVIADVPLRPRQPACPPPQPSRKKEPLAGFVAGVQLSGRPVWCAMMVLFFALTAFAVFALLGSFIVALDDTNTRIYDNTAFRNGDKTRIVVVRQDGEAMTQEDARKLLSLDYVQSLERYGYAADINYAYRKDVDYQYHYSVAAGEAEDDLSTVESVSFRETGLFVRSLPLFADGRSFIRQGRAPENYYEIAAADPELLGQTIRVYFQDRKNWSVSSYVVLELTVVGVTDGGEGLYFSDQLVNSLNCCLRYGYTLYGVARDLPSGEFLAEQTMYYRWQGRVCRLAGYGDVWDESGYYEMECTGTHGMPAQIYCQVSQADFDRLVPEAWQDQVSLTIADYAYTDRVLEAVNALGYGAISPFRECSTEQDPELASQRLQTLGVCLLALVVVLGLQVVVLRAMFGMETENYRLLSDIGLDCRTAKASVMAQVLLFTLAGQLLGLGMVGLGALAELGPVVKLTRYLPLGCWLILSGVHLAGCCCAGAWMTRSLRRQVYPFTAVRTDLDFEEVAV